MEPITSGGAFVLKAVATSVAASLLGFAVPAIAPPQQGDVAEWRFDVSLDGKKIGSHAYEIRRDGERRTVSSRAEFNVKFLFFNAYSYRHTLSASWQGSCLESIDADTNDDGKRLAVEGTRRDGAFVVKKRGETEALPGCIMNLAYWNPNILDESKLLNPQTGEYLDVSITELGDETVTIRGKSRPADAYRITARDMRIEIWYAKDDRQWLALESLAKGDRIIRYELT